MAKGGYIGVSDKARKITKGYIGVDSVARRIKKAYIGVNGVARASFGGNTWNKYSCDITTYKEPYTQYYDNVGNTGSLQIGVPSMQTDIVYTGWTFDPNTGFTGTGATSKYITEQSGYYGVMFLQVVQYGSAEYLREEGTFKYYRRYSTVIAECRGGYEYHSYNKGSTFYGKIEADNDVLPEQGTLLAGSIEGSYCVIRVSDGTTYYYAKA